MNCLNRIEIQEYLDREVAPETEYGISKHLETCKQCMSLYKQAVEDKELIEKLLMETYSLKSETSIPEFRLSKIPDRKMIYYRLIPVMIAASLIVFLLLFRPGRTPASEKIPESEILIYQYYEGKDLNKLWHEKSQVIILQDEMGNIIEPVIIY